MARRVVRQRDPQRPPAGSSERVDVVVLSAAAAASPFEPGADGGHYASVGSHHPAVLAYRRGAGEERLLVVLNVSADPQRVLLPVSTASGRIVLATRADRLAEGVALPELSLQPLECLILQV
jgi:hypothetical protein